MKRHLQQSATKGVSFDCSLEDSQRSYWCWTQWKTKMKWLFPKSWNLIQFADKDIHNKQNRPRISFCWNLNSNVEQIFMALLELVTSSEYYHPVEHNGHVEPYYPILISQLQHWISRTLLQPTNQLLTDEMNKVFFVTWTEKRCDSLKLEIKFPNEKLRNVTANSMSK